MKYLCIILKKSQLLGAWPSDPHRGATPGPCWGTLLPSDPLIAHPWKKNPAGAYDIIHESDQKLRPRPVQSIACESNTNG